MSNQLEEVIGDPALYFQLGVRIGELGGWGVFDEPENGFFPREVEIRRSPIPGRYSVTIWGFVIVYHDDEEVWRVKFKWEPDTGELFSVIPWAAIRRRWANTEQRIRDYVRDGRDVDPDLRPLLLEEAQIELDRYARTRLVRARELAAELTGNPPRHNGTVKPRCQRGVTVFSCLHRGKFLLPFSLTLAG